MKIETPKKPNKEASKWEEHMAKKAKGATKGEADIIPAKKKPSVAPAKGKVQVEAPAKAAAKAGIKKETKAEAKKEVPKAAAKSGAGPAQKQVKSGIAQVAKDASIEEQLEDLSILKHPLVTEKAVNMIEAENKLTFVVASDATKPTIKNAVESLYKVKVKKVSVLRDMRARKRAIVTLNKEFKAGELATKLGVI